MWSLINKKTGKIIKIWVNGHMFNYDIYAIGFDTKKGLLEAIADEVNDYEEIKKIQFEY